MILHSFINSDTRFYRFRDILLISVPYIVANHFISCTIIQSIRVHHYCEYISSWRYCAIPERYGPSPWPQQYPRAQDPSSIANTMPTLEMPSDETTDGVHIAAARDAPPCLQSAQKPVNSGTGDISVAVDAVFGPHHRVSFRARKNLPSILNGLHL